MRLRQQVAGEATIEDLPENDKTPPEPMGTIREVRKRDSRIVPFDETKIADAIYGAIRSVGEGDRALAVELASAVTHFLEEKFDGAIPGIEDIQDLVETVLIEMGHARVAKAYILYRQKRATLRDTLQVRKVSGHAGEGITYDYGASESGSPQAEEPPLPEVELGVEGVSRWQKSRIVAALIREADLDPNLAEDIASTVERKVFDSANRRISTSLIRELVDNELFERGFSAKLKKQAPLGLPKYNLEQLIFGTDVKEGFTFPKTPSEIRNLIANRILHQYSLEEVFTPSVAEAHHEGRIFLHRLSDPIRLSRLTWEIPPPTRLRAGPHSLDGPPAGAAAASYVDLRDFFGKLSNLSHFFSEEIRLVGLTNLLQDTGARALSSPERIRLILERLSQMDPRPAIALEFPLDGDTLPWLQALQALSQVQPRRFLISCRVGPEALESPAAEALIQAVSDLYEQGERIEFLPPRRADGRPGGPAADRSGGPGAPSQDGGHLGAAGSLRAIAAKSTLNLPRAAFRSSRTRGGLLEKEIEEVLHLAIKAHLERRRYIERLAANRENPLWSLLGRSEEPSLLSTADLTFSVGLLGLNECVKYLTGSDLHQGEDAARLAVDLVRDLERKIRREERGLGLRLAVEETANVGPLRILERMDRRKYAQMAEIDRGRQPQWGSSYTDGVRLHRMAPVDPIRRVEELSAFLPYVELSGGFIEEFSKLRSSARELLPSLLEECFPIVAS